MHDQRNNAHSKLGGPLGPLTTSGSSIAAKSSQTSPLDELSHRQAHFLRQSNGSFPSTNSVKSSEASSAAITHKLSKDIFNALEECPLGSTLAILPACQLKRLITTDVVTEVLLPIKNSYSHDEIKHVAQLICSECPRLFATLARLQRPSMILDFLDEGVTDRDLPFERRDRTKKKDFALCGRNGRQIRTLEEWDNLSSYEFDREQWTMLAPVFEEGKERYHFHDNIILPLTPINGQEHVLKEGGYSEVRLYHIHPSHHKFSCLEGSAPEGEWPLIAVKTLNSQHETDFEKEYQVLRALSTKDQPHLTKLLASYCHKDKYHFMFPKADGNLREYWERTPPEFNREILLWSLRQMSGISQGLKAIHTFRVTHPLDGEMVGEEGQFAAVAKDEERYGRHGDIKPENILFFPGNSCHTEDPFGILKIADFGLGRFHRQETRSNQRPTGMAHSPTYVPPELMIHRLVTRRYDIWSLGCIYLEFVTWLLLDGKAIEEFSERRGKTGQNGINEDNFFSVVPGSENGERKAEIREGVTKWFKKLHGNSKCSFLFHDLLTLVEKRMLLIDADERIKADELHIELQGFLEKAEREPNYLLVVCPCAAPDEDGEQEPSASAVRAMASRPRVTFAEHVDIALHARISRKGSPQSPATWPIDRQ